MVASGWTVFAYFIGAAALIGGFAVAAARHRGDRVWARKHVRSRSFWLRYGLFLGLVLAVAAVTASWWLAVLGFVVSVAFAALSLYAATRARA